MHILHTHFFTVHLVIRRRIWLEITMFFPLLSSFPLFSAFYDWYWSLTNRICRGKVYRHGSLLGVKVPNRKSKLFLVITTENKRSDRQFKYFIIVQNFQQKGRGVSVFFNARKDLSQSREGYSFHYVWRTLVCFGSWTSGPLDLWAEGSWHHYFQEPMRGENLICIWITY